MIINICNVFIMLESFCIGRSRQQLRITKGSNMSLKRNKQSLITQLNIHTVSLTKESTTASDQCFNHASV